MIKERLIISKIKNNEIVAIPSDTIFGLSCLPNITNIKKLNKLKQRSDNKGFILLTSNLEYLQKFIDTKYLKILEQEYAKITTPTTFIVPSVHKLATHNTLAIRLTDNPLITKICSQLNSAILSTSCNISGKKNINTTLKLRLFFKNIAFLTPNTNNKSSTIIDIISGAILRS